MIAIALGTRPEIIKMSPVIRECERRGLDYFILHTGQHYSYEMDKIFFEELQLPQPDNCLEVGSGTQAEQTARILSRAEEVLLRERPDIVLVQGDTNSTMGVALAGAKLGMKVGHVEAGLRSYDRTMPEEINRVIADHVSDLLFAPTEKARLNLRSEGIEKGVTVTGNTIVDAVRQNIDIAEQKVDPMAAMGLEPRKYLLVTVHRLENVDNRQRLRDILTGLRLVRESLCMPIVFPMHPRTSNMIGTIDVDLTGITVSQPIGYLAFLRLEANTALVLTDSGGVQEESCILGVPCVTLRENTERPETLDVGSNVISGTDPSTILRMAREMISRKVTWANPFGDGKAADRIVEAVADCG